MTGSTVRRQYTPCAIENLCPHWGTDQPVAKAPSGWTAARVDRLKGLYASGYSASEIANKLGGVTRNAVIGKIHRLKLRDKGPRKAVSRQAAVHQHHGRRQGKLNNTAQFGAKSYCNRAGKASQTPEDQALRAAKLKLIEQALVAPIAPIAPSSGVKILDLEPSHCRFPLGDPRHPNFSYCGAAKLPGLPYCGDHARRCFPALRTLPDDPVSLEAAA